MSDKYLIEQDGQFLGHHSAHAPREAVEKMLKTSYADCYNIDRSIPFAVTKNGVIDLVTI